MTEALAEAVEPARWEVLDGDCLDVLRRLPADSVDAVVTDPPYALSFMGEAWDTHRTARDFQAWCESWARECLRVLKPGGHLVAFGGTRTYHRLACAIEDAGFEIRDEILALAWVYGSGFPKSLNVSRAMQPEGHRHRGDFALREAAAWEGWGTALKPAHEPIALARKPLRRIVDQARATGTGALNIDACRLDTGGEQVTAGLSDPANRRGVVGQHLQATTTDRERNQAAQRASIERTNALGRWPANVVLLHHPDCERVGTHQVIGDGRFPASRAPTAFGRNGQPVVDERSIGAEVVESWRCVPGCPVADIDQQSGEAGANGPASGPQYSGASKSRSMAGAFRGRGDETPPFHGDRGGASRFFYSGKATSAERDTFVQGPERRSSKLGDGIRSSVGRPVEGSTSSEDRTARNFHPTVKPIDLMRWLCRLVTPPEGVILDPFTGSGSTGCAALVEGFQFIGIERDPEFAAIARERIAGWGTAAPGAPTERVIASGQQRERKADAGQLDLLGGIA